MIERLDIVEQRYNEITKLLQDPSVTSDINKYYEENGFWLYVVDNRNEYE